MMLSGSDEPPCGSNATEYDEEVPFGQKMWLVDDEEIPFLELRSLEFNPGSGGRLTNHAAC